jgi:hypothetical protein
MTLAIVLLTLATAAVHLSFFIYEPSRGLIYALNALGYVALVGALYLPIPALNMFRRIARWTLMGYAALTIGAYLAFGLVRHDWTMPLGPVDKLIEVILIALLWREDQHSNE